MSLIQPKPYIEKLKLRDKDEGNAARRLANARILDKGTPLPQPIEYSDIDAAFFDWVDKTLDIVYEGKRLPTYKLFSTQRISEYSQSWQNLDESGSLIMNFKTVTRENNPQNGGLYENYFNIPGHQPITVFYVPVLEDNGTEAYDKYTIEQPMLVTFAYKVSIVSNKFEVLNKMNELINHEFCAITAYISPNGHAMPMNLESVSDDSEYTIDDRKYYSQSFNIKVKGYIIRREDMTVERIPSRLFINPKGYAILGRRRKEKQTNVDFFNDTAIESAVTNPAGDECKIDIPVEIEPKKRHNSVEIEDVIDDECKKEEEPRYKFVKVRISVKYDDCTSLLSFICDKTFGITGIELTNVRDFTIKVNGEPVSLDDEVSIIAGDEIEIKVDKENMYKEAEVDLTGIDRNRTYDSLNQPETVLDEDDSEEYVVD